MKPLNIQLAAAPLENTGNPSVVGKDRLYWSWNLDPYSRDLSGRSGISKLWQRTSFNAGDVVVGAYSAKFSDQTETLVLIKHNGDTTATLYSVNTDTGVATTHAGAAWTGRDATEDWSFTRREDKIYALSPVDGMWCKVIGDTSEGSWRRCPIILQDLAEGEGEAMFSRPSVNLGYPTKAWGEGDWAGTVAHWLDAATATTWPSGAPWTDQTSNGSLSIRTTTNPTGSERRFYAFLVFTLTTPYDSRECRYLEMLVQTVCEWNDDRKHGEPYLLDSMPLVYVSDDATAPDGTWTDAKWKTAHAYWGEYRDFFNVPTVGDRPISRYLALDLDNITALTSANGLNAVKKIAIGVQIETSNDWGIDISAATLGGSWMSKPGGGDAYMDGGSKRDLDTLKLYGTRIKNLEYFVTYYNTATPTVETAPDKIIIDGRLALGQRVKTGLFLGAHVQIDVEAPSGGNNAFRVYRRRWSFGDGQYEKIAENATGSGGTVTDFRVDAVDCLDWASIGAARASDYNWGVEQADILGKALSTWRGSLVITLGKYAYISDRVDPSRFVKPASDYRGGVIADVDDPYVGNTVPISLDLSDTGDTIASQDVLYIVGSEGVYAGVGVLPRDIDVMRRLPGSYGSLNAGAAAPYRGGVLVASRQGLYWHNVNRSGALLNEGLYTPPEYLTENLETSWAKLLEFGATKPVRIAVIDDEIWVFRGRFYLCRARNGVWTQGEFSFSGNGSPSSYGDATLPSVTDCKANLVAGANDAKARYSALLPEDAPADGEGVYFASEVHAKHLVTSAGRIFTMSDEYVSDNGNPIEWLAQWGDMLAVDPAIAIDRLSVIDNRETATGTVRLTAESFGGRSPARVASIDYSEDRIHQAFRMDAAERFRFTVGGSNAGVSLALIQIASTALEKGAIN